ncbi:hypothetical protein HNV12_03475 [Methanococcoides sp. SA1]|nr:hypothetical protein [Methanococcoides sp. SA1]
MMSKKGLAVLQVWVLMVGVFAFGFVSGDDASDARYLQYRKGGGTLSYGDWNDNFGGGLLNSATDDQPTGGTATGVGASVGASYLLTKSGGDPGAFAPDIKDLAGLTTEEEAVDKALGDFFGDIDAAEDALTKTDSTFGYTGEILKHPDSTLSGVFKITPGSGASALASGVQWAAVAYFAGSMIGGALGMSDDNSEALGFSLAAGLGAYKALSTLNPAAGSVFAEGGALSWVGAANPALVGLGIGVVVFALMYKDTETKIVTFECMPWQAPSGGDSCEVCNDDDLACSEYKCRSLGANCEIVNEGTEEEKCVNVNPKDTNPPVISPDESELTAGHEYKNVRLSPPGPGFEIVDVASTDGCIKAFTPLRFGLTTDEPAQCKIDFNSTTKFDDMVAYFGGSNLYLYNHSETFSLPGVEDFEGSGFVLENGKDLTFFIRCKDKNGNENTAEYAVDLCIDPTPDSTAPKIEATSVVNGGCVAEEQDSAEVVFYTNEPSDCKWDFEDRDYDLMNNDMICSNQLWQANAAQLFPCTADLTGISRTGASYYVRCKDQPGKLDADRNENRQSYEFSLRGSTGLVLKNLKPNETIFGGVSPAPIELYAETLFGCDEGKATCAWSADGNNYIQFFDTDNIDGIHTQRLDLTEGEHEYFVRCVDGGGNVVENSTTFNIDIDRNAPVIARAYEEGQMLKIVTVRDSECSYTYNDCDFTFDEGTVMPYANSTNHVAEWDKTKTYYIKCRDEFRNEDASCSIVVRPSTNFL